MTAAPPAPARPARRAAVALAAVALVALAGCASSSASRRSDGPSATGTEIRQAPLPPPAPVADEGLGHDPLAIADRALRFEERGEYRRALDAWRELRPRTAPDADLELATALAEARTGSLDSAAARLAGPVLAAAANDTLPTTRYRFFRPRQEHQMTNGAFDGWHWYVWRARAEVAAARGRWEEATAAARRAVAARPASGKDRLLLALCAGRAGHADEARAAARRAVALDPGVPEAHYLDAVWAWRDGRRAEAQGGFEAAVALDPGFAPAVSALARARLPGSAPDSLPTAFLTGARAPGLLTSPAGPRIEEVVRMDQVPIAAERRQPSVPDSLRGRVTDARLPLWLLIDAEGRVALAEVPWYPSRDFPPALVAELMGLLPSWRFTPAVVAGAPRAVWVELRYGFPR